MNLLTFAAVCLLAADPEPTRLTWTIDGVEREAIVYQPTSQSDASDATKSGGATKAAPRPLVFAFHGHGGTMRHAARSFHIQSEWPEAVVVYMQGLPTPGAITDPDGKRSGWQKQIGAMEDRDLKFFDAVLATLKKDYKVDASRIYSTGHSNGGAFTYQLWAARPGTFAAIAPSAAAGLMRFRDKLTPCPCLIFAGRDDPLVKFAWQESSIKITREVNGCGEESKPWGKPTPGSNNCLIHESTKNAPVVTCIYDGGHGYLPEAPALIARFFKEHAKR